MKFEINLFQIIYYFRFFNNFLETNLVNLLIFIFKIKNIKFVSN
jgi:hypothetical protein